MKVKWNKANLNTNQTHVLSCPCSLPAIPVPFSSHRLFQTCRLGLEREEGDGAWEEGTRNRVSRKQEAYVQITRRGQQAGGWAGPREREWGQGMRQPGPGRSHE